jgi:hypothetical protein
LSVAFDLDVDFDVDLDRERQGFSAAKSPFLIKDVIPNRAESPVRNLLS